MSFRRIATPFVMVLALFAGACAARTPVTSGEQLQVQLQVENNLQGIQGVSIYLMSETGSRRSLGPIESNRTATYDRSLRAATYRLVATRVGQSDIVSEGFRLDTSGMVVVWVIGQNQITLQQR